jgi:hypothetical protein
MASDFLPSGSPPLVSVEEPDLGNQPSVDPAGGTQQSLGRQLAVDDKGEVALDRLEHRQMHRRLGPRHARLGDRIEINPEAGERRPRIERLDDCRMQLAKRAEHLRPEPQTAGVPGMIPAGRPTRPG